MTKTDKKLTEIIEQDYSVKKSLYDKHYSKTSMFLLRMIDIDIYNSVFLEYFVNSFLDDAEFEHTFNRPIFVLLKTKSFEDRVFVRLFEKICSTAHYKHDYDLGVQNGYNLVMIVCEVPEKYHLDYDCFKHGKYSKISEEYKKLFPQYVYNGSKTKQESKMWGAMHKSKNLKDFVADEFSTKDISGKYKDADAHNTLRKQIDDWDEIWDKPNPKVEIYRYKE